MGWLLTGSGWAAGLLPNKDRVHAGLASQEGTRLDFSVTFPNGSAPLFLPKPQSQSPQLLASCPHMWIVPSLGTGYSLSLTG